MNANDIPQIEKEIAGIEQARAAAVTANAAAIAKEKSLKNMYPDQQAANVQQLETRRDSVLKAYDDMLKDRRGKLTTAQATAAAFQAKQTAEMETRAAKLKGEALAAFIAVGGLPEDFDAHYQSVIVAQTVNKLNEKPAFTSQRY